MTERRTLTGAYDRAEDAMQRIASHEELCAEAQQRRESSVGR